MFSVVKKAVKRYTRLNLILVIDVILVNSEWVSIEIKNWVVDSQRKRLRFEVGSGFFCELVNLPIQLLYHFYNKATDKRTLQAIWLLLSEKMSASIMLLGVRWFLVVEVS